MPGNLGSFDDEVDQPGTGNILVLCFAALAIGSNKQTAVRIEPVFQDGDSPFTFCPGQAFHQRKVYTSADLGLDLVHILAAWT